MKHPVEQNHFTVGQINYANKIQYLHLPSSFSFDIYVLFLKGKKYTQVINFNPKQKQNIH
jgi:hypothetical protein